MAPVRCGLRGRDLLLAGPSRRGSATECSLAVAGVQAVVTPWGKCLRCEVDGGGTEGNTGVGVCFLVS